MASSSQPRPHTARPSSRQGPGPTRPRCGGRRRWRHRAHAQADVAQADLLRHAERARGKQDLHHHRRVVAHLPSRRSGPASPAAACRARSARRPSGRARNARPSRAQLSDADAAQDERRATPAGRRPARPAARRRALISTPAKPGPATSAPELASAFLRMRLDQALARTTCVSTICAAEPATRYTVPMTKPTTYSQVIDSQPSHQASGTLATISDSRLAGHVDRQLAHAVEPHARGQREQHEGRDLHRDQQAHLRRRGLQQHGRRQRQREHRHLAAEGADQDRAPQPPVDGVAQQVVGRQREALPDGFEKRRVMNVSSARRSRGPLRGQAKKTSGLTPMSQRRPVWGEAEDV